MGGSVAPSAHITSAFPSVESAFTTSISYAPFHIRISPSRTVTGKMQCAERKRNRGWCVHTGGASLHLGGAESSTTSRHANPTRAPNPTPNSNSCPNVGTSSPTPHSSRPRQSLSSRGVGGSRCVLFGLTPE